MSTADTKQCPYCGEEIKAIAIRCRYCQATLEGPATPSGAPTPASPGAPGDAAATLKPGAVIGRYELKQLLGAGGMGEVYLAEHTYTGQKVAAKAVWPNLMASMASRKRFLQEGRILAQLKHPAIVGLTDFFEEGGRFYLIMEYVKGETLQAFLDSRQNSPIPVPEVVRILTGVLSGLEHAHSQSPPVVHRDIKPSNVMMADDGRVVLMDFGIAKVEGGEKITRTQGVVGTYEYMCPEQVQGVPTSPASDVYSVGILAYELLTGDVPFPQTTDMGFETAEGHVRGQPPPLQLRRSDCPPPLIEWVEKALDKNPAHRFSNGEAMLAALVAVAAGSREPAGRPHTEIWAGADATVVMDAPSSRSSAGQTAAPSSGDAKSRERSAPKPTVPRCEPPNHFITALFLFFCAIPFYIVSFYWECEQATWAAIRYLFCIDLLVVKSINLKGLAAFGSSALLFAIGFEYLLSMSRAKWLVRSVVVAVGMGIAGLVLRWALSLWQGTPMGEPASWLLPAAGQAGLRVVLFMAVLWAIHMLPLAPRVLVVFLWMLVTVATEMVFLFGWSVVQSHGLLSSPRFWLIRLVCAALLTLGLVLGVALDRRCAEVDQPQKNSREHRPLPPRMG